MPLVDYLYVDLPKVVSLYSQLTGGVVESRESIVERGHTADNKRHYDFKVFGHDAGGTSTDKAGTRETIRPHHAVLADLESKLGAEGYLLNLDETASLKDGLTRSRISRSLCVKVTGRAVVEDYERIKAVAEAFPKVSVFINKSGESSVKSSPAYMQLESTIASLTAGLKAERDRNERSRQEHRLKDIKTELAGLVKAAASVTGVEPWILEGLTTWINTFLPGITNLRIYTSAERPDEHVFGHLRREYFEGSDSGSFHFTYGSVPTEPISMLGVVTAVPREGEDEFNPLAEFQREGLASAESVEMGYRGVFRGFVGLEQMIRTCRFPRVLVQPIVVYRSVEPNLSIEATA